MLASMKPRGLGVLALLLLALFLERAGYYGSRAFLALELRDQGEMATSIASTLAVIHLLGVGALFAGGAVAFGVGPRLTAAMGLAIAAMGHAAAAAGAPVLLSAASASLGAGIFRPCLFVVAAEVLVWHDESPAAPAPDRFSAVAAFAAAAALASNLGGMAGPVVGGGLRHIGSIHLGIAVVTMFATLAAVGVAALARADRAENVEPKTGPYRAAQLPDVGSSRAAATLGVIALLLLIQAAVTVGTTASLPSVPFSRRTWVYYLNPYALIVASFVVSGLLATAAVGRWSRPPLHLYGVGLVVLALGLFSIACAEDSSGGLHAVGSVFTGFGEAAAFAVPIAYVAMAVRGRAAALVVACWQAAITLVTTGGSVLAASDALRTPGLIACGILTLGAGAALLVFGRRVHDGFFRSPRTPSDPGASPA
jgi:hypothetical protein